MPPHVKNILVPIDTRESNSEPIVSWAALMARTLDSRLLLLQVHERDASLTSAAVDQGAREDEQAARTQLARLVHQYCGGVTTDLLVLVGRAPAVILGAIE